MVTIGSVVWPGLVGIGAGIVKGTASFVDLASKADSVEVGSITREPLAGNEGQTVWKYAEEKALRHNAGLPNPGAKGIVEQLHEAQYQIEVPWGLNVAVSPGLTEIPAAVEDISHTVTTCFEGGLRPKWLTLNVSSPDTQDAVAMLSEPDRVWGLLKACRALITNYDAVLWLKVSPGLDDGVYPELIHVAMETGVETLIATNTLPDPEGKEGGWSGQPLRAKARALVWELKQVSQGKLNVVGTGGVLEGKHVKDKLDAGASAVQVVSALLFRGRDCVTEIKREYELEMVKSAHG